jgi:hypothetical protein
MKKKYWYTFKYNGLHSTTFTSHILYDFKEAFKIGYFEYVDGRNTYLINMSNVTNIEIQEEEK